ncbi:hypothetical protein OIU85_010790, partial [Salix viminalis]
CPYIEVQIIFFVNSFWRNKELLKFMKLQNKVLEQMASHLFFFKIFSLVLPLLFVLAP